MKCAFQLGIISLPRKEVANMALYEIKNYIKLLCMRIDHIESYVVDELNTSDEQKINEFLKMYKHRKGLKILIFEMTDEAHMITYEQCKVSSIRYTCLITSGKSLKMKQIK